MFVSNVLEYDSVAFTRLHLLMERLEFRFHVMSKYPVKFLDVVNYAAAVLRLVQRNCLPPNQLSLHDIIAIADFRLFNLIVNDTRPRTGSDNPNFKSIPTQAEKAVTQPSTPPSHNSMSDENFLNGVLINLNADRLSDFLVIYNLGTLLFCSCVTILIKSLLCVIIVHWTEHERIHDVLYWFKMLFLS